jgi:hypothetical protein
MARPVSGGRHRASRIPVVSVKKVVDLLRPYPAGIVPMRNPDTLTRLDSEARLTR